MYVLYTAFYTLVHIILVYVLYRAFYTLVHIILVYVLYTTFPLYYTSNSPRPPRIFMVALFGVFIFLVFSMVLVLCCGTAYFGFIRATE